MAESIKKLPPKLPLSLILVAIATGIIGRLGWEQFRQREGPMTAFVQARLQSVSAMTTANARAIFREVNECIRDRAVGFDLDKIQAAGAECMMEVVFFSPDGSVRPNGEARLVSLMQILGVSPPKPQATGKAAVALTHPPNSRVFTVPVAVETAQKSVEQRFLLDTGATTTVIGDTTLQRFNLRGTPISSRLLSFSVVGEQCDRVTASLVSLPPIRVAGAKVSNISGMGINEVPAKLSGVLGMDFLVNYNLHLQPSQKRLELSPRTTPPPSENLLPLTGRLGVMVTPASINERQARPFLLDTGADVMVIGQRAVKELGIDLRGAEEIDVLGFCGTERAKRIRLASVQVGNHRLTNLDAVVIDAKVLDLIGVQGIVGQNFLNRFNQHWYFGDRNTLGYATGGFLRLTPIAGSN